MAIAIPFYSRLSSFKPFPHSHAPFFPPHKKLFVSSSPNDSTNLTTTPTTTSKPTNTPPPPPPPLHQQPKNPPQLLHLSITDPQDMEDVGSILSRNTRKGDVLLLDGDLGAGKTSLARGFVRARTGQLEMRVPSPTYLLSNTYKCFRDGNGEEEEEITIHHIDLYRLSGSANDLEPLDLPHVFSECISLIEWPSRLGGETNETTTTTTTTLLSSPTTNRLDITIHIDSRNGQDRFLTLNPHGREWEERLEFLVEEGYLDDLIVENGDAAIADKDVY